MKITEIILSYRAKKLDNLENWLIILVIDLFVIMALCYIDILSVLRVTESIIYFVKNQYNYNIIKYPLELFLILCATFVRTNETHTTDNLYTTDP